MFRAVFRSAVHSDEQRPLSYEKFRLASSSGNMSPVTAGLSRMRAMSAPPVRVCVRRSGLYFIPAVRAHVKPKRYEAGHVGLEPPLGASAASIITGAAAVVPHALRALRRSLEPVLQAPFQPLDVRRLLEDPPESVGSNSLQEPP
ncbi:hypothetical protein SAMN05216355_12231 [Actinomyces ruminicola]|uniref:Uncharacterized protein n=1 Tax=Actinomyces ruminicola TaxID=332524 RepID=A0A1H0F5I7_9ACTO|nr:hypothetical protein SAMN05216355_12231 [Actinomyces ruminicola]